MAGSAGTGQRGPESGATCQSLTPLTGGHSNEGCSHWVSVWGGAEENPEKGQTHCEGACGAGSGGLLCIKENVDLVCSPAWWDLDIW